MKKTLSVVLATMLLALSTVTAFAADTKSPSVVTNFKGVAMDSSVKLSWSAATDDVGVTGYTVYYGLKSVTQKGQTYDNHVDAKNVLEYTVTGLTNGTKYYFSVVAYDAVGNESLSWAKEVAVTPTKAGGGGGSTIAPQVTDASASDNQTVKVTFSEAIVLPITNPEDAFTIEDQNKFEPLPVTAAVMDITDTTNKTVVLTTAKQKQDVEYKLTVGIDVKDTTGNPIVSGTSDTAVFKGSAIDKAAVDTTPPAVTKVESVDNTHFVVTFDGTINLSIDPSEDFKIVSDTDSTKTLTVLGVKLGTNSDGVQDSSAVVTTSPQEKIKYDVTVLKVKDAAGNEIAAVKNTGSFTGVEASNTNVPDIIPPKDVLNFLAEKVLVAKLYAVKLTWKIPTENIDTVSQLIYKSTDKGVSYSQEASLGPDKTAYQTDGLNPGEYWFKITGKDAAGNESKGVIAKIVLPKTGPEIMGLVIFSLFAGRKITKRKNKNKK